jgi:hypothetical protein
MRVMAWFIVCGIPYVSGEKCSASIVPTLRKDPASSSIALFALVLGCGAPTQTIKIARYQHIPDDAAEGRDEQE